MKKRSIWSRIGDFLMGKGFYMVLLLCVMAIGGSGYYLYHLASAGLEEEQAVSAPAEVEVETEAQPVSDPEVSQELADALAQAEAEAQAAAASQEASEVTQQAAKPDAAETQESSTEETTQAGAPSEDAAAEQSAPAQETAAPEPVPEAEDTLTTFAPPVPGETVAAFSDSELTYNAALEDWRTHNGVDLAAELGDPVSAVLDGEVLSVTADPLLGTTITLNHGDGLMTVYGNLAPDVTVEQGDTVTAGETLGSVGNTAAGEVNEGAWIHFAVEQDGVAVDPMDYLS